MLPRTYTCDESSSACGHDVRFNIKNVCFSLLVFFPVGAVAALLALLLGLGDDRLDDDTLLQY